MSLGHTRGLGHARVRCGKAQFGEVMQGSSQWVLSVRAQGRIVVFEVRDRKLHVICEKETKGAVYSLCAFQVS